MTQTATKERPILFSGPMVRAILEGRKTQTRRVVKPSRRYPIDFVGAGGRDGPDWDNPNCWGFESSDAEWWMLRADDANEHQIPCPYGAPGERLYVREAWWASDSGILLTPCAESEEQCYQSARDSSDWCWESELSPGDTDWEYKPAKKKPSIHVHRKHSRITLEVKRVWVERVQEISEADAIAEGCPHGGRGSLNSYGAEVLERCDEWFARLWDSINAKTYPWASNPWVWCVEYERVES